MTRTSLRRRFADKDAARDHVWSVLEERGAAAFPFPPRGRIPNFTGARRAAERLLAAEPLAGASVIKVNPDAPQAPLRREALRRGLVVLVPTPRLREGFVRLDPARIPENARREAAGLSGMRRWGRRVSLGRLPTPDAIVVGSVAVTRDGRRCGKGHGYADLEFAILRELGHPPCPVLTSVHELQLVGALPREVHDVPVSVIATPERLVTVEDPPAPPAGVDWSRLCEQDLEAMPVLAELRARVPHPVPWTVR